MISEYCLAVVEQIEQLLADVHRAVRGFGVDLRHLAGRLVGAHGLVDVPHLVEHRIDGLIALGRILRPELDRDARAHDAVGDSAHPFRVGRQRRREGARQDRPEWSRRVVSWAASLSGSTSLGSGTIGSGAPPLHDHQRAADHAAEMREMGDAREPSRDAEQQLRARVQRGEQPRGHGDRRNQRHHLAVGKHQRVGEQKTEHAARRPQRRAPAARPSAAAR